MTWALASAIAILAIPASPLDEKVRLEGGLDLSGHALKLEGTKGRTRVLIFVAADCPIANRYAPEIERTYRDYRRKPFDFTLVYLADLNQVPEIATHGKKFQLSLPVALDPNHRLVAATGATVTPEAVVVGADGTLLYRGRIDDRNVEHGKVRQAYRRDLRVALDEIASGQPVSMPRTAAIGCFISQ